MIRACLHSVNEVLAELRQRGFFADCSALVTDHRRLTGPRDIFVAVVGQRFDPRNLADAVLQQQHCGLVLVEYDDRRVYQSASVLPVLHLHDMLAELAAAYYEQPSEGLRVIAVTGTNGKTTVTRWLAQALNAMGHKAAVIGTLGYGEPDDLKPHSGLTTPDAVGVQHLLRELRQRGIDTVCIEASSIGLEQGRLACVKIDLAAYTNFSQDHLDYHGDMLSYSQAKLILADWPTLRSAVVNVDDALGLEFQQRVQRRGVACLSVGRLERADCRLVKVTPFERGQNIQLQSGGLLTDVQAAVSGGFNADNLALVFAVLQKLDYPVETIVEALTKITPAPGRMQQVSDYPCVIVDYAHTPDALEKALNALRPLAAQRQGRLWAVFGCGGDRDKSKRPVMGQIAAKNADGVVLTSDNPRSESPDSILHQILEGVDAAHADKVRIEPDRTKAIQTMIDSAADSDVILLAGKGHENTQTIGSQVIAHSDQQCAQACIQRRGAHA